jgi:hypothetical protein
MTLVSTDLFYYICKKRFMESGQSSHSVYSLQVHIVWITKYRYRVLQGEFQFTNFNRL